MQLNKDHSDVALNTIIGKKNDSNAIDIICGR